MNWAWKSRIPSALQSAPAQSPRRIWVGGLIPLAPYMMLPLIAEVFMYSVVFRGLALLVFGGIKGHSTGINRFKSAVQALLVGDLAAVGAYMLAHAFG